MDWIEGTRDKSFAFTVYSEHNPVLEDITSQVDITQIMVKTAESEFKYEWRE